jgi:NAD(P)-dependent dehydrogenase (short-subunit alcohol dehydrogenase family)
MDFNNQTAIITGGGSGLGLIIVKTLLKKGANVAVLDMNCSQLQAVEAQYQPQIFAQEIDLTDEQKVKNAIENIADKWQKIDILVNSAGITGKTNIKTHELDIENVKKVMYINFMASLYTSVHVLPYMLDNNYGRILHIASIAGKEGNAGMLAYSASKAAVIGMTKVQGKEYAETGITINALAPAVIFTPLVEAMPEAQVKYMTDKIPMKRCGTLEEAANMVLYIVSPQNSFTTGFTFDLSGGRATY